MECREFEKHIDDYLMKEKMSPELLEEFEAHYFECESCFDRLRLKDFMLQILQKEGVIKLKQFKSRMDARRDYYAEWKKIDETGKDDGLLGVLEGLHFLNSWIEGSADRFSHELLVTALYQLVGKGDAKFKVAAKKVLEEIDGYVDKIIEGGFYTEENNPLLRPLDEYQSKTFEYDLASAIYKSKEFADEVINKINNLHKDERLIFCLKFMKGVSFRIIGGLLDQPEGDVESKYNIILTNLGGDLSLNST